MALRLPQLMVIVVLVALMVPENALAVRGTTTELSVNLGTMPTSLDPGRADYVEDLIVANAIFTPLYRSPGGSSGRLVPHLAARRPIVANGGRRYTVPLRAARWSDGRAILARDVVFAFNRSRQVSAYGAAFDQVRSVRAIGTRTVRFELRRPVPWFGELLASNVTTPVPWHVVRQHGRRWTNLDKIVVSGPFEPISGRGRSELVLGRNARWWGARRVKLKTVKLLAVTQASGSSLFRARRLDVGLRNTSVHPTALASWKGDSRLRTEATGAGQYAFLNTRLPHLSNAAVRRGIALAIDRAAIVTITGDGVDRPLSAFVPSGVRGAAAVAPSGGSLLLSDGLPRTTEAKLQLAAGGWTPGTTLDLYYPTSATWGSRVAGSIRTSLLAVGIPVTLHGLAAKDFAKQGIATSPVGDGVDIVLQEWAPDYSDPQSFHQLFTCSSVDAGLNPSNFCNASYDGAYEVALAATGSARIDAHRAAESLLGGVDGLMPAVPLYEPVGRILVQPWVRGFRQHPSGLVEFERISIAPS